MTRPRTDRRFVKSDSSTPVDAHLRRRDYLTPDEVKRLLSAARSGRHAVRDHLMLLLMYRHGLRVSELISLRRTDLHLTSGQFWVQRLKRGLSTTHPMAGDELRALRRHLTSRADPMPWLFLSERRQPLTRQAVNYLLSCIAKRAGLGAVHPHMRVEVCIEFAGFFRGLQVFNPAKLGQNQRVLSWVGRILFKIRTIAIQVGIIRVRISRFRRIVMQGRFDL